MKQLGSSEFPKKGLGYAFMKWYKSVHRGTNVPISLRRSFVDADICDGRCPNKLRLRKKYDTQETRNEIRTLLIMIDRTHFATYGALQQQGTAFGLGLEAATIVTQCVFEPQTFHLGKLRKMKAVLLEIMN